MTVLDMNPATLPAAARALYETMAARRKSQGRRLRRPLCRAAQPSRAGAPRSRSWGSSSSSRARCRARSTSSSCSPIARATGADYEWHDHIEHARAAGLPADVIDAHRLRPHRQRCREPYALAHAILAKTTAWQVVPDDLQAQAAAQWGKRGLVEIVVLSGFYQMFAAINQGFDIRPRGSSGPIYLSVMAGLVRGHPRLFRSAKPTWMPGLRRA